MEPPWIVLEGLWDRARQRRNFEDLGHFLYSQINHSDRAEEPAILKTRSPVVEGELARRIVGFVPTTRRELMKENPGIAETLDFAAAIMGLRVADLISVPSEPRATLMTLLNMQSDREWITPEAAARIAGQAS